MRRIPRTAVALLLVASAAAPAVAAPAGAEELPPGFTDGQPVGAPLVEASANGPGMVQPAAAATERYFGEGAYAAVRWAVGAATPSCALSDDALTALVLAPVFKESSAATSPSTAPSPMTLSRYDEWNGVMSDSMGTPENNYGLYAFRNPSTPYKRAFWHPGLGIWQYDTAGLGAPLTTIEAMDVGTVSAAVANLMAAKYCNPSAAQVGHGAPFSAQERRYSAWGDWGYPCTLCEGFYDEMIGTTPNFANLNMVAGISALGGVVPRTCSLTTVPGTMPCWYVEPRVGVIQGATAWATFSPLDGGSSTAVPTPLAHPFYVLDRGTTEERHWLRADTGYSIDIRATRTIGKDARPRSTQAGSGLTWSSSSALCDLTAGRGTCFPVPPAGVTGGAVSVVSSNRAIAADVNGDAREDVLWYGPGSTSDLLWMGNGSGSFSAAPLSMVGTYDDLLPGDVDDDGDDDVIVYNRTSGAAYLMRSRGDGTFTLSSLAMGAGRVPFLLDSDGNGDQELFWYGKDAMPDALWNWAGSAFSASPRIVPGTFTPYVGDFDGDSRDDIFWYVPGAPMDKVWLHRAGGGYSSLARQVAGTYRVSVGDFDGDDKDDLVWYAPGSANDSAWFGATEANFARQSLTIVGDFTPIVASIDGTGRDGLILYATGPATDRWFRWSSTRTLGSNDLYLPRSHKALVGRFSAGAADGILWHEAGSTPDIVWYR